MKIKSDFFLVIEDTSSKDKFLNNQKNFFFENSVLKLSSRLSFWACRLNMAGPPLIYLVGLFAISDLHINISVGPPNTCVALKQFNILSPNTLF